MALELRSISKKMGSFRLSELSLRVEEGEYFMLLGPSGVGKSVLLEIVAGLQKPDSGQVAWDDRDLTATPPERRGFAIVYQDYALFPHLTVAENILYGLRARGWDRVAGVSRVNDAARLLGIALLLDRFPSGLSGGEQQRTALARALVLSPQVMLLDEPLAALDMRMRRQLRQELKRIHHESRATFVHVTHDVEEAMVLGDRIGVMLAGRIHQIGSPVELSQNPTSREVADFLELRNVFTVSSYESEVCEVDGVRIHVGPRAGRVRHLWIRPEEILLSRAPFQSSARNQFGCVVEGWEFQSALVSVKAALDCLNLHVSVTYASFKELGVERGGKLYATFKSSAIHCF